MTTVRRFLAAMLAATALASGPAAPSPAQAAPGSGSDAPAFNIVRFEPIIVTLFDSNRAIGLMSVTPALQVPTQADKEQIEAQRVRYLDAFNTTLMQMGRLHVNPRRPLDVPLLARTLETTANRLHGGKAKLRVLVLDASTRPLH